MMCNEQIVFQDFSLPRDMVYFCQPDGTTFTYKRRPNAREKNSFVFTLTDKDTGITRYGITLNFYRGVEKKCVVIGQDGHKRQTWKQANERSSDSAFSRYSILPFFIRPLISNLTCCVFQ